MQISVDTDTITCGLIAERMDIPAHNSGKIISLLITGPISHNVCNFIITLNHLSHFYI